MKMTIVDTIDLSETTERGKRKALRKRYDRLREGGCISTHFVFRKPESNAKLFCPSGRTVHLDLDEDKLKIETFEIE